MESNEVRVKVMKVLPEWHHYMVRPFRRNFDDTVTPMMYYCLEIMYYSQKLMTMTELSNLLHATKQQMTKLVNRLISCGLAERVKDSADRRVIRLQITREGQNYVHSIEHEMDVYYGQMTECMTPKQKAAFMKALDAVYDVLSALPCDVRNECCKNEKEDKE